MPTVLFSTIFLLPLANGDFTSFHLHNFLNHSVSACADFHSHVCSAKMNRTQTIQYKSLRFYVDWAIRIDARSSNNIIMNNIKGSLKLINDTCEFNVSQYEWNLRKRCGDNFECYIDEFRYFLNIYQKITNQDFDTKNFTNIKPNITRIVEVTSRTVGKILQRFEINHFAGVVLTYLTLQYRLAIMNDLERTNTADQFEILDEMSIGLDFDEQDRDLETWRRINQTFTSRFFEYSKKSTSCPKLDTYHPLITARDEIIKSNENWITLKRLIYGLKYNGFYNLEFNTVVLFATTFYPLLQGNSSTSTVDGCSSGEQTLDEDAPDVEATRIVYEMFRTNYTEEQLKELEYDDLGITRDQAFFYARGVHFCNHKEYAPEWGRHSNHSIRLNSVVSMMPEFTAAFGLELYFGCKPGDAEYADEESVCHIFGPRAVTHHKEVQGSGDEVEVDSSSNEHNGTTDKPVISEIINEEHSGSGEVPSGLDVEEDLLS